MSVKVKIDGKVYEAQKGEYIMDVAKRNDVFIPGFCNHESLSGQGCCRLCVVDLNEGGKNRTVVSCIYPVEKDCEVSTESEKIKGIRRTLLSMLKGRAPHAEEVEALCAKYGVPKEKRYTENAEAKACILCGLCVEACNRLGAGAISSAGRGTGKKITTPYDELSADCIGCASCASVCPTSAIECQEGNGSRVIWNRTFDMVRCTRCGKPFAVKEQLDYITERLKGCECDCKPLSECETCRQKKTTDIMAKTFGI